MALSIINVPADTWTLIAGPDNGVDFQVLGDRECFWKYAQVIPTAIPFIEPVFQAQPGQIYHTAEEWGYVWAYAKGHAVNIAIGHKTILNTRNYSKYSPLLLVPFNRIENTTTLSAPTVIDSYTIPVTSVTGITAGKTIIMYSRISGALYVGTVLSVVGNTLNMDTPINSIFTAAGTVVDSAIINMNVDGSGAPVSFRLRGPSVGNLSTPFIISRIIIVMYTVDAVQLDLFGDIAALLRGVVLRELDGYIENIFNVKSNGDISRIAFDNVQYSSTNPAQGQNGAAWRLTFGGDSKIGAPREIERTEDLEILIQDDLRGLQSFTIMAEGYALTE
jgi:hypothetical protein